MPTNQEMLKTAILNNESIDDPSIEPLLIAAINTKNGFLDHTIENTNITYRQFLLKKTIYPTIHSKLYLALKSNGINIKQSVNTLFNGRNFLQELKAEALQNILCIELTQPKIDTNLVSSLLNDYPASYYQSLKDITLQDTLAMTTITGQFIANNPPALDKAQLLLNIFPQLQKANIKVDNKPTTLGNFYQSSCQSAQQNRERQRREQQAANLREQAALRQQDIKTKAIELTIAKINHAVETKPFNSTSIISLINDCPDVINSLSRNLFTKILYKCCELEGFGGQALYQHLKNNDSAVNALIHQEKNGAKSYLVNKLLSFELHADVRDIQRCCTWIIFITNNNLALADSNKEMLGKDTEVLQALQEMIQKPNSNNTVVQALLEGFKKAPVVHTEKAPKQFTNENSNSFALNSQNSNVTGAPSPQGFQTNSNDSQATNASLYPVNQVNNSYSQTLYNTPQIPNNSVYPNSQANNSYSQTLYNTPQIPNNSAYPNSQVNNSYSQTLYNTPHIPNNSVYPNSQANNSYSQNPYSRQPHQRNNAHMGNTPNNGCNPQQSHPTIHNNFALANNSNNNGQISAPNQSQQRANNYNINSRSHHRQAQNNTASSNNNCFFQSARRPASIPNWRQQNSLVARLANIISSRRIIIRAINNTDQLQLSFGSREEVMAYENFRNSISGDQGQRTLSDTCYQPCQGNHDGYFTMKINCADFKIIENAISLCENNHINFTSDRSFRM